MAQDPKKGLEAYVNERLKRWAFDRVLPPSRPMSPPITVEEGQELVIRRLVTTAPDESAYPVIGLTSEISRLIVQWHGDNPHLARGEPLNGQSLQKWIEDEIAFVVTSRGRKGDPGQVLWGFLTATKSSEEYVEIGQLLVNPEKRNAGIGQAILSNVANLVAFASKDAAIYARTHKQNKSAADMMSDIRKFKLIEDTTSVPHIASLAGSNVDSSAFHWYRWDSAKARASRTFGDLFKKLRVDRGLTQQIVAQRAGITRESINQLEHDGLPSHENIPRLLDALSLTRPLDSETRAALVFSVCGYDVPSDLVFSSSLEQRNGVAEHESRWTLSDRPIELTDQREFERTVEAIVQGYSRYFFVPRSGLNAPFGRQLCMALHSAVHLRVGQTERLAPIQDRLRLYVAPSGLCRLRMVIFGPELHDGNPKHPRGISIIGPKDERIALGAAQAARIFDDLCDAIRPSFHPPPALPGCPRFGSRLGEGFELIPLPELDDQ